MGDWLEMYTRVMELNYWGSTTAKSAQYDEKTGEWTVVVDRAGKEVVLKPKQLVLATGMSGKANVPKFPGQDIFKGEQQHSSSTRGRMLMPAERSSSSAPTIPPTISAQHSGRRARMSPCFSAPLHIS